MMRKIIKNKKIKYCIITTKKSIHKYRGIYKWVKIFKGKILFSTDKLKKMKFDIIQINMTNEDFDLINKVKKIIGNNSKTKIIASCDINTKLWKEKFKFKKSFIKSTLKNADFIYSTDYLTSKKLENISKKKVYEINNPLNLNKIKKFKKNKKEYFTIFYGNHFFNIQRLYNTINTKLKKRIIIIDDIDKKELNIIKSNYKEVKVLKKEKHIIKCIAESKYILINPKFNIYNKYIIYASLLDCIVFSNINIDSSRRCYPLTSINFLNYQNLKGNYNWIEKNENIHNYIIRNANNENEFYSKKSTKNRLLYFLNKEKNKNYIQKKFSNMYKIYHLFGKKRIKYNSEEFVVVCIVKNGQEYINEYINHYLNLGAKHIYFIANNSTDNTIDIIKKYKNVSVYYTNLSFDYNKNKIKRNFIRNFCFQNWCLYADIDELFDYPYSDKITMKDFLRYLNKYKYTTVISYLLDMFPNNESSFNSNTANFIEKNSYYNISNIKKYNYFDHTANPYCFFNTLSNDNIKNYSGGIRKDIFGGKGDYILTKHPLMYIDHNIEIFKNPHFLDKAFIADITCILKHYKFLDLSLQKIAKQQKEINHSIWWKNEYKAYYDYFQKNKEIKINKIKLKKLNNINQLIEENFIIISENYNNYINHL